MAAGSHTRHGHAGWDPAFPPPGQPHTRTESPGPATPVAAAAVFLVMKGWLRASRAVIRRFLS